MQNQGGVAKPPGVENKDVKAAKRRGGRKARQRTKRKAQREAPTGSSDVSSHSTVYQTTPSRHSVSVTEKSLASTAPKVATTGLHGVHEVRDIIRLLPKSAQSVLETHEKLSQLVEVVMDLGRVPFARFVSGTVPLSATKTRAEDLQAAKKKVGAFGTRNRAGINGTLHRVSCIRNRTGKIVGLTCRVGRDIPQAARLVEDIIQRGKSVLLLGSVGVGKTTALRCMSRFLSDVHNKRVVIVDTYNEIAVPNGSTQDAVMMEALHNHAPEVIVVGEIGSYEECVAARRISRRGVQLISGAWGSTLNDVLDDPVLQNLVGGVQIAAQGGGGGAQKRSPSKTKRERKESPSFDVVVEILSHDEWGVTDHLAKAVDIALNGDHSPSEIRSRAQGSVPKVLEYGDHIYIARGPWKPTGQPPQPPQTTVQAVVFDDWDDNPMPVNPLLAAYDTIAPLGGRSSDSSVDGGDEEESRARFVAEVQRILAAKTHEDVLQVSSDLSPQEIRKRLNEKMQQLSRKVCPSESGSDDTTAARKRLNAACRAIICRENKLLLSILEATSPHEILQVKKKGLSKKKLLESYHQKEKSLQAHAAEPYVKEALHKLSQAYRVVKKSCAA